MRFENKKVVIAGGCSDMGIACAKKLLAQGAKVVLVDISDALLAKADGLKAEYLEQIHTCLGSVASSEEITAAMAYAAEQMGGINVLINCAGIGGKGNVEDMVPSSWKLAIDVTLSGTFYSCRAAVPYLKKEGAGRIINVASIGGRANRLVNTGYSSSKAAVCGLGPVYGKGTAAIRHHSKYRSARTNQRGYVHERDEGSGDVEGQKDAGRNRCPGTSG